MTVIFSYSIENIQSKPESLRDLNAFTPSNLPLFFGVAVFNFEGNAVILSLHKSMKEPEKFSYLLKRLIILIMILCISLSSIAYAVRFLIFVIFKGYGDSI